MMKKNTLLILNGITLLFVIFSIAFIIQSYIHVFDRSLFEMQRFIVSQEILITMLKKTIIGTVLVSAGIAGIALFLMSYESEKFLLHALGFFAGAGLCVGIWDTTVMFLAGRIASGIWNRAADIFLLLYICLFYSLCTANLCSVKNIRMKYVPMAVTAMGIICVIVMKPVSANLVTKVICSGFCILSLMVVLICIFRRFRVRKSDIFMLASVCFISVVCGFGKLETLSGLHRFYRESVPFLVLICNILYFLNFYQYHRTGILFGREANRRLHELTRHKEKITQLIIEYCQRPINLLKAMSDKLQNNYNNYLPEQKKVLQQMDGYIHEINKHIKNIGEYSGNYFGPMEQYHINVDVQVLIHNALSDLETENMKWSYRQEEIIDSFSQNEILGDPFQLVDAIKKNLSFLYGYRQNDILKVNFFQEKDFLEIIFNINAEKNKKREIKKICRQFLKKLFVSSMVEQELIPLAISKQYIEQNGGSIRLALEGEILKVYCKLPTAAALPREETEERESLSERGLYTIVLISALPQQIELIKQYLLNEKFSVKTFFSAEDALMYLESHKKINVIIVGDMFDKMDTFEVCAEIRKEYPLEQLPILMISHEPHSILKTEYFLYVNDIIYEPFEYLTFLQKLHSLIILQESVRESTMSKLDFLQAQMDPHFIFNTISTIMPLCIENPMEAYNLLGYFSEYLRGSLYHKGLNTTVPLEKELDLIDAYLKIQEIRFNHMIEYTLEKEEDTGIRILPLILEPIVENCVKHGRIEGKKLYIKLEIHRHEDGVQFTIQDNGKGMSEEKISEILSDNYGAEGEESHSIGLYNLKKRLQIYYQSVLKIESQRECGTKIYFVIPYDSIK